VAAESELPVICALFIFCAIAFRGDVPARDGLVSRLPISPYLIEQPATVLLAHSNLTGQYFDDIDEGDTLIYNFRPYRVREIVEARAEEPASTHTRLMIGGEWVAPVDVYRQYFADPNTLILFTCIDTPAASWGRLMVIAERYAYP
jgi:hypothetical protein